jgi:lipoyl-dependent peroxiredoxin
VRAECALDEVDGAPKVTRVALSLRARVPGADEAGFAGAVDRAATLCPVSNVLCGNVEIDVHSELES